MTKEEIQTIAKEIVIWLSEEKLTLQQAGMVIKTAKESLNYCTFDASNLLREINTQQPSDLSNHAQPCKQDSGGSSYSVLSIGLSLKSTTALRMGQANDIKNTTSEETEKARTHMYAQQLLKFFADKKILIKDVVEILENTRTFFRESILGIEGIEK